MATDPDFVEFVTDQIDDACDITYRKMFGEYALYSKGKTASVPAGHLTLQEVPA